MGAGCSGRCGRGTGNAVISYTALPLKAHATGVYLAGMIGKVMDDGLSPPA
jgi:hypothetical protein